MHARMHIWGHDHLRAACLHACMKPCAIVRQLLAYLHHAQQNSTAVQQNGQYSAVSVPMGVSNQEGSSRGKSTPDSTCCTVSSADAAHTAKAQLLKEWHPSGGEARTAARMVTDNWVVAWRLVPDQDHVPGQDVPNQPDGQFWQRQPPAPLLAAPPAEAAAVVRATSGEGDQDMPQGVAWLDAGGVEKVS